MKASQIFFSLILSNFCLSDDFHPEQQRMLAVIYSQTAAEHHVAIKQTYSIVGDLIKKALSDTSWNAFTEDNARINELPPAIVIDVDETILDNSPYEARLIFNSTSYPDGWDDWCFEASAQALPGAVEFLKKVKNNGIEIFYVTNRRHKFESSTRENFKKLGIPISDEKDTLLMRDENGWGDDKYPRKQMIAKNYRIIFQLGDNLGDFVSLKENKIGPNERKRIADLYQDYWGKKWFMIENPQYGDWESSIYDHNYSHSAQKIKIMRQNALQPE